jgi:hypothetical protein
MSEYAFELPESEPPGPVARERLAAFYDELEAAKRILACASDVHERVKTAVEASTVAELFEVVESTLLTDGQVLSIDPALLRVPMPVIDMEAFKPQYRCLVCLRPTYDPGRCASCSVYADSERFRTRTTALPGIITGLGL